ncbi:MAG: hypothetical protein PHE77_00345 [Candidatus Pacebacteria bacterium]|nr:hypothetical protein [Candidatus Paceibacterota bacterium]
MIDKKLKGQFFTTNSNYILYGFDKFVRDKNIVDPFAGNKDLINWAINNGAQKIKGFDIDKRYVDGNLVLYNDSILDPQEYDFVLTNPPYLHKNKASIEVKNKYFSRENGFLEDLYQISLKSILNSQEGILIVPLNFLSAENSDKIRRIFFSKFEIIALNIFTHKVFEDTTYNVVSFFYRRKKKPSYQNIISAKIFPAKEDKVFILDEKYGWQLGGEFHSKINLNDNFLGVRRLTENHLQAGECEIPLAYNNIKEQKTYRINQKTLNLLHKNIILLRAIDSKNGQKVQLEDIRQYGVIGLVGKESSRNMASFLLPEELDIEMQEKIIDIFNKELTDARKEYFSFFLTNFRDNNRKRISFDFAYKFINYIYFYKMRSNFNRQRRLILNENQIETTI